MIRPRPSDFIWGLVCGYAEAVRSKRMLLMLKAYFDDSNMGSGTHAVLAGWVALADHWARFSEDWDKVLRMSPRIEYFKWRDSRGPYGQFAGMSDERRIEKITLLASLIAEYEPLGVASVSSNKLHKDIFGQNPDPIMRNPYFLSFYSVVIQLVTFLAPRGWGPKIDFIFDIQPGQMEAAIVAWERLREVASPEQKLVIGNVSFHDDIDVLPLQAADMSAGWMREQADAVFSGQPAPVPPWGDKTKNVQCLARYWDEELYMQLAQTTNLFKMPPK